MDSVDVRQPQIVFCTWRRDEKHKPCGERIVPDLGGGTWFHWMPGNTLRASIDRAGGLHDAVPPAEHAG